MTDSTNKRERLEQLFGHPKFAPAFDAFRHIRALYVGLRLGVVNKMISMGCHEVRVPVRRENRITDLQELLFALKDIKVFWYSVFDNDESAMERLDSRSVLSLENTAPGACQADADRLYGRVVSGERLSGFNGEERMTIWNRLCSASVDRLVPSLYGFFENLKYLQKGADCMKRLVQLESRETIRAALENAFWDGASDSNMCTVQVSASSMKMLSADGADQFDIVYRQLWLYAMREFPEMPAKVKKKLAGPEGPEADERVLFYFASLAYTNGIRTTEIRTILDKDADRAIARRFLQTARKPEEYTYDDLESGVTRVVDILLAARPIRGDEDREAFQVIQQKMQPNRSGIPHKEDQARDKVMLFLDKLHGRTQKKCPNLTSFFIQRSIYFTFFGKDISIDINSLANAPCLDLHDSIRRPAEQTDLRSPRRELERRELDQQIEQQRTQLEQLTAEERNQRATVQGLQEEARRQEERLRLLGQAEQEYQARAEQLESAQDARLAEAKGTEQTLQVRLDHLRQEENEQRIRLDKLETEERERHGKIGQLRQTQHNLGEQIRLDLLAEEQRDTAARRDEEQEPGSKNGGAETEVKQRRRLDELAASEREKLAAIEHLEARERQLQENLDQLSAHVRPLTHEEEACKSRIAQLVARENELQSVVDRLGTKELELRETIDQLAACQDRLEAKVSQATQDEKEQLSRIQRLATIEQERQAAVDQLVAEEKAQHARLEDTTRRLTSKKSHEDPVPPGGGLRDPDSANRERSIPTDRSASGYTCDSDVDSN